MNKYGHHRDKSGGFRRLRKPLIIALAFAGFFVFSNYSMGLFNATTTVEVRPPVVAGNTDSVGDDLSGGIITTGNSYRDTGDIGDKNGGEDKNGDGGNNPTGEHPQNAGTDHTGGNPHTGEEKDPAGDNGGKTERGDFGTLPEDEKDPADDPAASCKHTRNRDYASEPIIISGRFSGRAECDVPCVGEGSPADAVVGYRQSSCPHIKSIFFTMENSIPPQGSDDVIAKGLPDTSANLQFTPAGSYDIIANTQLTSDVPLPYFSWAEYAFQRPVQKKTATAQVAAFISNCGPQKRLQWMEAMMKHGVQIHSYGNCMRNREVPSEYTSKYGGNYNALKTALVGTYKFTMAFENSATDDYVTEKLFGVLVAGSVPLYDGAPNGKKFGPSNHSLIFANDFGTPEKLAEHILYLDKNDTAYEEYLQWKRTGPSDAWVAMVDMSHVHSNCRLCIKTADLHRKEVGPVRKGQPQGETRPKGRALELQVRERGKFWLRPIYLTAPSFKQLQTKIVEYVPHEKDSYLFSIYDLWSKNPITTDDDLTKLKPKTEIEVIFVVPQNWTDKNLL